METILAIYTILLAITIVLALSVNHRCHRLDCGIPMKNIIEALGASKVLFLLTLSMTILRPITLVENLYAVILDDERFIELANRRAITF